jgi:phage host-nuclease inhibitor protein Gam
MIDQGRVPATKGDLQEFIAHIERVIGDLQNDMDRKFTALREEHAETRRHFDVVAENIRHDLLKGALNDKVEQHEDRIIRLEQHAGLIA